MDRIARLTGELPLKTGLPAEILVVGVPDPTGHHFLIAEVLHALKDQKTGHRADRLGRTTRPRIKVRKSPFQLLPLDPLGKLDQRVLRIDEVPKGGVEQVPLSLILVLTDHNCRV
jgi:hypothetical protein